MRLLAIITAVAESSHSQLMYFLGVIFISLYKLLYFSFHFFCFNHTQEVVPLVGRGNLFSSILLQKPDLSC